MLQSWPLIRMVSSNENYSISGLTVQLYRSTSRMRSNTFSPTSPIGWWRTMKNRYHQSGRSSGKEQSLHGPSFLLLPEKSWPHLDILPPFRMTGRPRTLTKGTVLSYPLPPLVRLLREYRTQFNFLWKGNCLGKEFLELPLGCYYVTRDGKQGHLSQWHWGHRISEQRRLLWASTNMASGFNRNQMIQADKPMLKDMKSFQPVVKDGLLWMGCSHTLFYFCTDIFPGLMSFLLPRCTL